jgi:DNA-binding MarR family transcriptional regulator
MWKAGAFCGSQIQLWKIAYIMGVDIDTVHAAIKELEAAGLAQTSTIQSPREVAKWYAELTATGVRVYNQLGHR